MKKGFLAVLLLGMTGLCAFAQTITLDEAIASAAGEIGGRLDKNTKIAVLNISSPSKTMAEYVIDELSSALVNDGRLLVVERDQEKLGLARQELNFNDSEEVSNKSAQQIGRMLGAQAIINGSMKVVGGVYRLTLEVLEVETAIKRYSKNFNVQNDQQVRSLIGSSATRTNLVIASETGDFTVAQRTGAMFSNILFGAGSFKQKDKLGGWITAGAEAAGVVSIIMGMSTREDIGANFEFIGVGLYMGGLIFGAYRVWTFHKPGYIASIADPFNIALVSDQRGDAALQLSYTFHY